MSKKRVQSERELRAYSLGWDYQQLGEPSLPLTDKDFMKLIEGSEDCLPLLRAWNRGWHAANLAA